MRLENRGVDGSLHRVLRQAEKNFQQFDDWIFLQLQQKKTTEDFMFASKYNVRNIFSTCLFLGEETNFCIVFYIYNVTRKYKDIAFQF